MTNAVATYYTTPAAAKARIDAFSVVNYSGVAATFSIWLVPTGGTADNTNLLVKDRSVAAGASGRILEAVGQWLGGGGTIQMSASATGSITVLASGIEQTAI
ncbi:hypothetical protein YP76_07065 [Sphingobium chungbukense]|uniref:Uncharacterized protein n=1 Tax=Sphingobium chungbukense TaxID=56193 RepID=A0A0M3AVV3_9SPHN|nr:hypothetical protein YP76_07065 [Sphingobium chungbukense]